ncbi:epidermal growth factor receptor kinase substrate 8 isoform X2 [Octopus sinensis]|uniref:Epidermal growth factor receptor kinase substrate 8 isoform X2 n=1 Tax=Octopus sinensis TaxID=2607531 RepID=A0A7E6F6H5_9MOLL|nr:epidermal growth factor receptor kinase substrate 8 isoform X2 [Octopus sinensis]
MPVGVPDLDMNYFNYNGYDGYMPSEESFGYNDVRRDAFMKSDTFQHIDAPTYSRQVSRNDFAPNPARPVPYASSGDRSYDARMSPMGQSVFFEVDHLATFTVTHEETHNPEAGVAKLSTMANTSGIWTMKCTLAIERNHLIIKEKGTESMLDCFPLPNIYNPFAITKSEKCDVYNNLVVLSVIDNTKRDNQPQMHIFLAGSIPAQDIVDEILNAKAGRPPTSRFNNKLIPPPPTQPAPEPPNFMNAKSSFVPTPDRTLSSSLTGPNLLKNENSERDGQLLNHCFDDIEKFVARLQKAAESYKELERLKKDKGGKEKRGRQEMEEKLTMSALPPKPQDFVDIFQKFKLSFNLLAKLKGHIHDPNAPELVHFIFTPLSLIYEASRDPTHGNRNLAANVYSPMLTAEAKELLLNCLTSKEVDLWMSFGEGWTTSREDYKGYVPPYTPRFYNGWHPAPSADDYAPPQQQQGVPKIQTPGMGPNRGPVPHHHEPYMPDKIGPPNQRFNNVPSVPDNSNELFMHGLRERGVKCCEATHYREKKNGKELTVVKGEVLEILDDSRNWWKLKNSKGQVGHAPYTILSRQVPMTPIDNGYASNEQLSSF